MCVLQGCVPPIAYTNNLGNFGLSPNVVCDQHYTLISNTIGAAYPALTPNLLADFTRLKILMLDKPTVEGHLATLDANMPTLDPAGPNGPWIGKVLGRYEKRCYFPDFLIVPLGFIKEGFDNLGRSGYLPMKDIGAGIGHGKYTHRIQWHTVMRTVTNQFQSAHSTWNYSPLELFLTSMSTVGDIGPVPGLGHHSTNLFGYIFDLAADGAGSYSWPDELFSEMRKVVRYPHIGRAALKNWTKRNQEDLAFRNAMTQYTQDMNTRQQMAGELFDARAERNQSSGPARWIANANVGKAKAALDQHPLPVKPMSPSETMKQRLVSTNAWAPMGSIPNADPFQRGGWQQDPPAQLTHVIEGSFILRVPQVRGLNQAEDSNASRLSKEPQCIPGIPAPSIYSVGHSQNHPSTGPLGQGLNNTCKRVPKV